GATLIGGIVGFTAMTRAGFAGLVDRLRASRSTSSRAWRRAQSGLVTFQVAIALVLLVAAALLGRSFWNLRNAKIGFKPEHAMTFQVSLPWDGYTSYGADAAFHAKVLDRLSALPGVTSVGVALRLPLASHGAPLLESQLRPSDDVARSPVAASGNMASAEYFHTMGIPLLAGRSFRSGDLRGAPAVVLSARVAMSLFGTTDVVGRRITRTRENEPPSIFTIVGVVGDVHWERIEDGYVPTVYFPLLRDGDGLPPDNHAVPFRPQDVQYAIHGTRLPSASGLQEMLKQLDRRVPASRVSSLGALVDDATARVRLTMLLIAFAGAAALLLGVIGVYSVVSYAASGRVREFGIRLALGAAPSRVAGLVLNDGVKLVAIGTCIGVVVALGTTRFLR